MNLIFFIDFASAIWYNNLSSDEKSNWVDKYLEDLEKVDEELFIEFGEYPTTVAGLKAFVEALSKHESGIGLPKYLYEDILGNCTDNEDGTEMECTTYGYWTKTPVASYSFVAWYVTDAGFVNRSRVDYGGGAGVRPVIKLSDL